MLPELNNTQGIERGLTDIALAISQRLFQRIYPVGSLWLDTTGNNPASVFGFGTWVAYAEGQALFGKKATGTFATAGGTGGAETVTLTAAQSGLVGHNHTQNGHAHAINESTYTGGGNTVAVGQNGAPQFVGNSNTQPTTATNNAVAAADASAAHSNLPPYVVIYVWKRTA